MDVAGSDSLTPAQGLEVEAGALGAVCEVLADELEGPAIQARCGDNLQQPTQSNTAKKG